MYGSHNYTVIHLILGYTESVMRISETLEVSYAPLIHFKYCILFRFHCCIDLETTLDMQSDPRIHLKCHMHLRRTLSVIC